MLGPAVESMIGRLQDPRASEKDREDAVRQFFAAASRAATGDRNQALRKLVVLLKLDEPLRLGLAAKVCGALVEHGCDPGPLASALLPRLQTALQASAALADACCARMQERPAVPLASAGDIGKAESGEVGMDSPEEPEPELAFEEHRAALRDAMPNEHREWEALRQFWPAAIAVFSVSPEARSAASGMRPLAAAIAEYHEAGHWLRLVLSVLDDEPFLAIEPRTGTGLIGRMSGIAENFQLNVLLMDAFPKSGFFSRRRVTKQVAEVARGVGPQQTADVVVGAWDLHTWQAIRPDLTLPPPGDLAASNTWIWNEGVPEDIPVFERRRVILLGPPSYSRTWGSQRAFKWLPARLDVERSLTKTECRDWLRRMASALNKDTQ